MTAFRTSFNTLLSKYKRITFLRTITRTHVNRKKKWGENGDCERTRPFSKREAKLDEVVLKMYSIQLDEFRVAERERRKKGLRFRVLNVTESMTMRPDGHPNQYGHWPHEKVRRLDCLHWCLPGPNNVWNEMLLQMIEMENER
ncbi:Protein trichome birefringence-like 20 [Camellia lanceoleosa]|uniref:Protein trichome birefringence-like 20 n=1 Tax=Camellia lanceoleosa TaxID=1840588 RepID=A0ACC0HZE9_9ERIC|nr:Protein trichome birefringence-like 20 [Camellia lanceoleosa]